MFELKNVERKIVVSLDVVGYQFPKDNKDNWCLLKVIIEQENKRCELVDPAIETTELVKLLHWFTDLSEGRLPSYAHLTFIEPCISFQFLAFKDGVVRIAIRISHELKPDFEINQFGRSSADWSVICEINQAVFNTVLSGIKATLESFPVRGG